MKILALESSTALASVALNQDGLTLRQESSPNPKSHSEFMNFAIENILKQESLTFSDIDLFAVSIGPGSFTGIRVALNIAKAYSFLLEKPIFAIDSLAILHQQVNQTCLCLINAYKNMIYWSAYKNNVLLCGPMVTPVALLEDQLRKLNVDLSLESSLLFVGDGYNAYETSFSPSIKFIRRRDPVFSDHPQATTLAKMALNFKGQTSDWNSVYPLYLRASEAEENLKKKNKN